MELNLTDIRKRIGELEKSYKMGNFDSERRLQSIYYHSDSYLNRYLAGVALYGKEEVKSEIDNWAREIENELGINQDFGEGDLRDLFVSNAIMRIDDLRELYRESGSKKVFNLLRRAFFRSDSQSVRFVSVMDLVGCCIDRVLGRVA